jgi:hypothetical protein
MGRGDPLLPSECSMSDLECHSDAKSRGNPKRRVVAFNTREKDSDLSRWSPNIPALIIVFANIHTVGGHAWAGSLGLLSLL